MKPVESIQEGSKKRKFPKRSKRYGSDFKLQVVKKYIEESIPVSHANDHDVEEIEIERMAKFCEVLLVIALFLKLNIDVNIVIAIINRLNNYHVVMQREV